MVLVCKRGRLRSIADVLLLKSDFGGEKQDRFERTIGSTAQEVAGVLEALYAFGRSRELSRKMMHRTVLCVEEMAGNVVRHAFSPGETGKLDLLVLNKPHELIIRIRDNRMMFDPVAYLKKQDFSTNHLGIRITNGIADRFEYRRTIGLNNVLMIIRKTD